MNESTHSAVYLTPLADGKWSASVGDSRPSEASIHFVDEKAYPVDLLYARTDLNGSSSYEKDTCQNREALVEALNWLGNCRWTPVSVWDFDIDASKNDPLIDLLNKSAAKRLEVSKEAADAMYDDLSESNRGTQTKEALSAKIQSAEARRKDTQQKGAAKDKTSELPH